MSIIKHGKVTVSKERVSIEQFTFADANMSEAADEALKWAIARCNKELKDNGR